MQCPVCKTTSCSAVDLEENLEACTCQHCGGHWLSHANYVKWLEHRGDSPHDKPFSDVELDVDDVTEAKLCPECKRILLKYRVGHGLDFFVDHCLGCGGIWLDKNEWEVLQAKDLHDEIHKMFSTAWQNRVRGDRMIETLDQVYANRFGADTYERAKETREWLQNHPQKQALLAFLSDDDPYKA